MLIRDIEREEAVSGTMKQVAVNSEADDILNRAISIQQHDTSSLDRMLLVVQETQRVTFLLYCGLK